MTLSCAFRPSIPWNRGTSVGSPRPASPGNVIPHNLDALGLRGTGAPHNHTSIGSRGEGVPHDPEAPTFDDAPMGFEGTMVPPNQVSVSFRGASVPRDANELESRGSGLPRARRQSPFRGKRVPPNRRALMSRTTCRGRRIQQLVTKYQGLIPRPRARHMHKEPPAGK
jgi:hypothetical protein